MSDFRAPSSTFVRLTIAVFCIAVLVGAALNHTDTSVAAQDQPGAFQRHIIDLGTVVTDAQKSIDFYTKVLGFKYAGSFAVGPKIAADAGLTDANEELKIHRLVLGDGPNVTTLKLIQFTSVKPGKPDNRFIHSSTGFSYITVFVKDMTASLAHAAEKGHKPIANGPADLGGGRNFLAVFKDPDGNFVEFVGPKK